MKNEMMGVNELYLAPETTTESEHLALSEAPDAIPSEIPPLSDAADKQPTPRRIEEIVEQRGNNVKVYRMSDGTEQAVFSSSTVHVLDEKACSFEDVDNTLTPDEDGLHLTCGKNPFVAKFSREEDTDDLFSIEKGTYKVTVYASQNEKNKDRRLRTRLHKHSENSASVADVLTFADVAPETDYEYSVDGGGVKENIVIKNPRASYRYPFTLRCDNLTAHLDEQSKCIAFTGNDSAEEVFFIPAPFMTDANGMHSNAVEYELEASDSSAVHLTVTADPEWINAPERTFPVIIDPQIKCSGSSSMTTYSWEDGSLFSNTLHTVGSIDYGDGICHINRMYLQFSMPTLPRNPRIKKAEIVFTQYNGVLCGQSPKMGLYRVEDSIYPGYITPSADPNLIDYAAAKESAGAASVTYAFDITSIMDQIIRGELTSRNLVLQMLDEDTLCDSSVTLYGSANSTYSPKIVITYESSYGVNTSHRTHTHELGRFGRGSVDLQCGNLMFESEDFAWSGNRMPISMRHLYNSALSNYAYTNNSSVKLTTANFSGMILGNGFKLNLMQSMVPSSFIHEGTSYSGYVYVDENGEETHFKETDTQEYDESTDQCYNLYADVGGGDMIYDPVKRTLKQGEDTYLFDTSGKLTQITDASGNHMNINYSANRITSVVDGAGRVFNFTYSGNYLKSITAPDGRSTVSYNYNYTGTLLTEISYPDSRRVEIAYDSNNKPSTITILNTNETTAYRVAYTYIGDRVASVTEYGANGTVGAKSTYSYSAASSRTLVTTTEPRDSAEGESADNVITTTYTFDDDGNIVSEYVYSTDTGNVATDSGGSGINPYSGDGGAKVVSNINNLLVGHGFDSLAGWSEMPGNYDDLFVHSTEQEYRCKYGKYFLDLQSYHTDAVENGIYQTTNTLPKGQYTFSAYLRVTRAFAGGSNPGAFLRVTDASGNSLGVSDRLVAYDSEYTRLILPFTLSTAQSVKVQILVNGKGTVYVDGAQLENNPFANAYNMLENGNFERGTSSWTCSSGVSTVSGTYFNMSKSLRASGNVSSDRYAYQDVTVSPLRSTRETFTLSGWAKGYGLPSHDREGCENPRFRLRAVIKYSDLTYKEYGTEEVYADFSPCTEEWQLASVEFSKSKCRQVAYIRVYCDYGYNSGTVYFDDIQLTRKSIETGVAESEFTPSNTPDTNTGGDVIDSTATADDTTIEATDTAPTFVEAKDDFGNALTETTFTDGEFGTLYRSFGYTANGNDLTTETDARGFATGYAVNPSTSRNEEVIDRLGNKTAYEYDDSGRTTKVTSAKPQYDENGNKKTDENDNIIYDDIANVSYAYDVFDNMTEIARGDGMKYALAYNEFHNLESIGINGRDKKLIHYTYKNGNGRLKQMTYANGDTMKATYNSIGQMISETWFDKNGVETARYKYVYDGEGNIVRSIDIKAEKEYTYEYEGGNIVRATEAEIKLSGEIVTSKTVINTTRYYYDTEGKMTRKVVTPAGGAAQTVYYEQTDDNTVVKFSAGGRTVTSHSKSDSFGRKEFDELQLGTDCVSRQFVYHAGEVTQAHKNQAKVKSSATTQLVSQIILYDGRTLSYEYDAEERITKLTDSVDGTTEYTYDALGQLLTEKVNNVVVNTMTYDNYGNIKTKNGVAYTYDSTWKDLLRYYNGQSIFYDDQGNPTSYLGHTLTWEKGRQLKKFDNIEYTYNANGIRTSKTVNGVKHEYTLDGTKILRETWPGNTLIPLYDNEDSVCGILYNGTPYYFIKNLQGDVIAIVDKDAQTVAKYSYDAWGAVKSAVTYTDLTNGVDVASINPFRYRSYYYDEEIGLYYLLGRYYDPTISRFLNCDDPNISVTFFVLENNLFAYAINDPVNNIDIAGYIAAFLAKKIGAVLINAAIGLLAQILGDVLMSAIKRKWHISSLGTYIAAVAKGAWDGLWGGGIAEEICKSLLANILSQCIDMIRGKKKSIDLVSLLSSILDGLLTYVVGRIVKVPKYIRDIKSKARSKFIKGTKKLIKYLNKEIWKKLSFSLTLSGISNFITQFVERVINALITVAKEMYNELKKEIGGMKVA